MTIEDDIAFFERVPTLNMLGRAALRILAIGSESRYVHSGEVLFTAGDPADSGFVIQEGAFDLTARQFEGGDSVVVGRGTLIGELALLTETVRPVTATAKEPSTVLRIPRTLFLKMLEGYPDAAATLREIIAKRADQSTNEIYGVRSLLERRRY
ncbi:MAG: cyclic nucleotide-binding domain-containing protein [Rhizobiales bacterium]|nr:cyclic nucleotide-binding domain-containing protein [Hyphomicrobiales bacterium]